ncbi:Hypothetical protein CINCED_3A006402 [Cinara cedri]|uniref:Uncharacterized protein n=1 Tax=Cinara cedri TaxID=506608 RepID=A0A5E4MA83_9HEMI|nr:Hypothetical protein CINCED_3A006402 [Cinara cedri]
MESIFNKYDDHIIQSQYETYKATSETNFNRDGGVITFEIKGSDSFLNIKRVKYIISGKYLKQDITEYEAKKNAFLTLAKKLKPFLYRDDEENLEEKRIELLEQLFNFSKLWNYLKNSLEDEYHVHNISNNMNDEDENQEEEDLENQLKPCNTTCKNCAICCYKL